MGILGIVLGWGSSAWGFITKNWKIFAIIALLVAGYFYHERRVDEFGNRRFKEGVEATLGKAREQIAASNERNRIREQNLNNQLIVYADRIEKLQNSRIRKEERITNQIENLLQKNSNSNSDQCMISEELLKERNKIRALGPKNGD